jgi:hypothetical protein
MIDCCKMVKVKLKKLQIFFPVISSMIAWSASWGCRAVSDSLVAKIICAIRKILFFQPFT